MTSSCSSVAFRFSLFSHAEGEIEGCTLVQFSLCPHSASMLLNDALHRGQADARTFELLRAVQPLEDSEQFVDILHVETDAVVSDHEDWLPIFFFVADFDDRVRWRRGRPRLCLSIGARTRELERIGQQVLKDLLDQNGITLDHG